MLRSEKGHTREATRSPPPTSESRSENNRKAPTRRLRAGSNAILDAIDRLHKRTGATQYARRDIVSEVQRTDVRFERQTIYRCIRRMTGHESGSAYHDLDDLGNDHLRLRA